MVSPDYSEAAKFSDLWLHPKQGTDSALAMAMGHVILREFYVEREVPYFTDYARRFTDLPLLVTLREREGAYVPDRFLRASDLGADEEHAEWKTVVLDERTGEPAVPSGSVGHRYAARDEGRWNLLLDGIEPALSLLGRGGVLQHLHAQLAVLGEQPALGAEVIRDAAQHRRGRLRHDLHRMREHRQRQAQRLQGVEAVVGDHDRDRREREEREPRERRWPPVEEGGRLANHGNRGRTTFSSGERESVTIAGKRGLSPVFNRW